ncbi:MAG: hypothetical protein DRP89_09245 [Candidatus Neomarinimicrobiota bacterium]|nr:MAG: hypothetical protein DRP89_09245 [Candidatus Neomarinimicrobiota bacterium]
MSYLEINLDPFISLEELVHAPLTNPLNLLSYVESIGVSGVSFTYRENVNLVRDISTLRSMTGCRFNIRVPANIEIVQKILPIKPDMLTVIDPKSLDNTIEIHSKDIKVLVNTILNSEDLGLALRIQPKIKLLKEAYQLGVDEVEIATNDLAKEKTHKGFLLVLEKITHTIRIATKNNLRVSIGGDLDRRIITALNEVVDVEFISVGNALLSQSLITGFESALKELMELVEKS